MITDKKLVRSFGSRIYGIQVWNNLAGGWGGRPANPMRGVIGIYRPAASNWMPSDIPEWIIAECFLPVPTWSTNFPAIDSINYGTELSPSIGSTMDRMIAN